MLGSSDQGSTEQCTITNSSGILIAGQLQTPQIIGTMAAVRVHPLFGTTSGSGSITNKYALLSEASGADIQLTSDAVTYIGDKNTDGSWRYKISAADLVYEKRVAGVWT
jgi:prephenate dehydrogenase